jgi:tetraacyldisaccharide 4'-kinase
MAIAVFDERGSGNGWLLPAGLLREPWPPAPGAAYRPDVVLLQHREGAAPPNIALVPGIPVFTAVRRLAHHAVGLRGQRIALEHLQGQAITAVAGIARPSVFFDMLRTRGLTLAREVALPDHAEPAAYTAWCKSPNTPMVCTEKDAVKCFAQAAIENGTDHAAVWAVPLELAPEAAFLAAIDERLAALKTDR